MTDLRVDDPSVKQWHRVCGRLREEVGDAAYQSWVKPMMLGGIADGQVRLAVPTRFLRDWVNTHYAERIRALWAGENPEVRAVKVEVAKAAAPRMPARRAAAPQPEPVPEPVPVRKKAAPRKKPVASAVDPLPAPSVESVLVPVKPAARKAAPRKTAASKVAAKVEDSAPVSAPAPVKARSKTVTKAASPKAPAKGATKTAPLQPAPVEAPVEAPVVRIDAAVAAVAMAVSKAGKLIRIPTSLAAAAPMPVAVPVPVTAEAPAPVRKATTRKRAPVAEAVVVEAPAPAPVKARSKTVSKAAAPKATPVKATPAKSRAGAKAAGAPSVPENDFRSAPSFVDRALPTFDEDDFDYAEGGFAAPDFDDLPDLPSARSTVPLLPAGGVTTTVVSDAVDDGLSAPLDPRYTFENFVTGKPNEFAYAAAQRVADSDRVAFNPLFLYGGVGLGKTHLMHAIAWAIRERHPGRRVVYLSAEKFMYSFVKALRYKTTMDFKEQFRSVDVLMIDDVQFISGKDSTQEEFFHTFNALVDQGRQIVISADKSPADLEDIGDRLRSRLASGLVADIHPTTYELRLGILAAKAEQMGTDVPTKVLEFLAHKISSNVRELEGALTRLIAHAQLVGRDLSLETAQDVLRDVLRANDRRITIEDIQKKVAEHFQIRLSDMGSARRSRSVARPRQVAMYLSKQLTSRSLPEIGRKFGGRDHTTVMHAVKKVEELIGSDDTFAEDVDLLRRMLEV
ncbi:chromosomal replication initiator protein DnaA [Insolitispirillum peregrinum]|uniref:Chromosomal replication initiator protein DnaA n=1 Tax=Insolitispirillum peregrinum TaxID=80876 RepID=A0A1N7MTC5_9PROT|nr:chromosomal replication initiator protein DnaA [Insolitispirillum peregrinum]